MDKYSELSRIVNFNMMAIIDVVALVRDSGTHADVKMTCIEYAYDCFRKCTRVNFEVVEQIIVAAKKNDG